MWRSKRCSIMASKAPPRHDHHAPTFGARESDLCRLSVRPRWPAKEVLTNCLVNNFTNLTLILVLPALLWGLALVPSPAAGARRPTEPVQQSRWLMLNPDRRLSVLLTLVAVLLLHRATWVLGEDGRLDRQDGFILIGSLPSGSAFSLRRPQAQRPAAHFVQRAFLPRRRIVLVSPTEFMSASTGWSPGSRSNTAALIERHHLGWLSGWLMSCPRAARLLLGLETPPRHRPTARRSATEHRIPLLPGAVRGVGARSRCRNDL